MSELLEEYRKCTNCVWEGPVSETTERRLKPCPVCGDQTVEAPWPEELPLPELKLESEHDCLDLNRDGKVDREDLSLAGKLLSKFSRKKGNVRGKKKGVKKRGKR